MPALAPLSEAAIAGSSFRSSSRTQQHLLWTTARLAIKYPGARLEIIQPCYNTGVELSAGTHDYDATFDFRIIGLPGATDEARWWAAQRFLRECGWAAWFRHTGTWAARNAWHLHAISLPPGLRSDPTAAEVDRAFEAIGLRVGEFVPGQVDDYYAHALGLKGQHRAGADGSWFPPDINATVFEEDKMEFKDWSKESKDELADMVADRVWAHQIGSLGGEIGKLNPVTKTRSRRADGVVASTYNRTGGGTK